MATGKKILLLDDDPNHLSALASYLTSEGHTPLQATNVEVAEGLLRECPDFAIVDLFLAGEQGSELSAQFISDFLIPAGIPYGRMSSAPDLVPAALRGSWVVHKRDFWNDPDYLHPYLVQTFGEG